MPNWCEVDLVVANGDDLFDKVKKNEEGHYEILRSLVPIPESEQSNWYDWSLDHWGCKWPDVSTERDGNTFHFRTPWSPPIEAFSTIAAMFPRATFDMRYYEMGMGYQGHASWDCGRLLYDDEEPYDGDRGG